jgi:putative ABC transport system permease protein
MGIPMLAGRDFTSREMGEAPDVVIINETMVRRFFADINPIGQRLQIFPDPNRWREIVGVVADVKLQGLDLEVNPALYVPMSQNPYPAALKNISVVSRTTVDPKGLIRDVEHKVRTLDKEVPLSQVRTMEEIISSSLSQRRLSMTLLVVFAVLAALLAMIGIYGVMAYTVAQRTHELGIRMAMGAQRADVLRSVLVYGAKLAGLGVLIGLILAFSLTRVLATLLYGVGAFDPATYFSISILLIFVALLASFIPALRASKLDPLVALRNG